MEKNGMPIMTSVLLLKCLIIVFVFSCDTPHHLMHDLILVKPSCKALSLGFTKYTLTFGGCLNCYLNIWNVDIANLSEK